MQGFKTDFVWKTVILRAVMFGLLAAVVGTLALAVFRAYRGRNNPASAQTTAEESAQLREAFRLERVSAITVDEGFAVYYVLRDRKTGCEFAVTRSKEGQQSMAALPCK